MNRYQKVQRILDAAIGGPTAPAGPHGPFWRGLTRDQFVAKEVFQLRLITPGNGAGSVLVKALRGQRPFGADTGEPDADYSRMPSGLPPVGDAEIRFIERWIDDGCPEDELARWGRTNAPLASSRTDDIFFVDRDTGWAVNSDGNILHTADGGRSWAVQHAAPSVYLRCVGFAGRQIGWVGTLSPNRRLFHTRDGGITWSVVSPLPAAAPVAICGLSVVNERVIFAAGTNRPGDVAAMLKSVDGGVTWTAWNMSAHASVLIDTFFVDELHGWVVGGKAAEPTPTTRDKLRPVVLETTDGGRTWTNRLAGQELEFPAGEWGWKLQFLGDRVGFVSLENLHGAAILRTRDGGATWTRLTIDDPQRNANLEGIGFIDESRGWVGGWGDANFSRGCSSATVDGGAHWQDANEIGRFINRFRFVGDPVDVGYASGDTVYKYTEEPIHPPTAALAVGLDLARSMLPATQLVGPSGACTIPLNVPAGARRLSLQLWSRFGDDHGFILDELRPAAGARAFSWDGIDARGRLVPPGDYLVRLLVDDLAASSRLTVTAPISPSSVGLLAAPPSALRPLAAPTLRALISAPRHDLPWLKDALQAAIRLELFTLPPYLTATWTVVDGAPTLATLREITREEMLHLGLVCNLLVAIGGTPSLTHPSVVPTYPGPLPAGVHPGLVVGLRKLDRKQLGIFMEIERPQTILGAPLAAAATIGEFYAALVTAFREVNPPLVASRQLKGWLGLQPITDLAGVEAAIAKIVLQGEGTGPSPFEQPDDLAHFYRFGVLYHGRMIEQTNGEWHYDGATVTAPTVHDMRDVPEHGYRPQVVADAAAWREIEEFDQTYSEMLRLLERAWGGGGNGDVLSAWDAMKRMTRLGRAVIASGYGPCFRYIAAPPASTGSAA